MCLLNFVCMVGEQQCVFQEECQFELLLSSIICSYKNLSEMKDATQNGKWQLVG